MTRSSVVFPEPFGPTIPTRSPSLMESETLSSALMISTSVSRRARKLATRPLKFMLCAP